MRKVPAEQLLREAEEVEKLSPENPALPRQLAVDLETIERVFFHMAALRVTILEAPANCFYVLGDTPFPTNLLDGFTLPLSCRLALLWEPAGTDMFPDWTRRLAVQSEVEDSNRNQVESALKVVVGPTKAVLEKYATAR
jgi:hypothetical protein